MNFITEPSSVSLTQRQGTLRLLTLVDTEDKKDDVSQLGNYFENVRESRFWTKKGVSPHKLTP